MIFQAPCSDYYVGLFDNKTELAVEAYQEKKDVPVSEISCLINKFMTHFCSDIHISSAFKFGFSCNKASCTHLACVDLQYPYLTKKIVKNVTNFINYIVMKWFGLSHHKMYVIFLK